MAGYYRDKARTALRFNALMAAVLGFTATFLLFAGKLPFPNKVAWFSLVSSCSYALYFLFFDWIFRNCYRTAGIALSQVGSVIITISIYYTGGVVSPLPFLYMAILVSEAIYGLENSLTVPVSALGYLVVVWGIYYGALPNPAPWAAEAYARPEFPLIVSALLVPYLALTKNLSDRIIRNLRSAIAQEASEKDALVRKFSELNSTTQLGVLAHRIAHDLRGPIASISGYIQVESLKDRPPAEKATLRELEDVVANMSESLRGITRFGRAGGGRTERIVLHEFMDTLLAIVRFSPQAEGVAFKRNYGGGGLVSASRADLQQAFFNVLKNAVEAVRDNPGEKLVEVSVRAENGDAVVAIADNGPGILPELLPSIFRKSITTKKEGTGVGMLITRDLLLRNGGDVELRNRPEGGLEVAARLPLG